jgi:hypothetical protein
MKILLTLLLLTISAISHGQVNDMIVTKTNDTLHCKIVDVVKDISKVEFIRFYKILDEKSNEKFNPSTIQVKTQIELKFVDHVYWNGSKLPYSDVKISNNKDNFYYDNMKERLLLDNGDKKIKSGAVLLFLGTLLNTTGFILSTQNVNPKIPMALWIGGGVNMTIGSGLIWSGSSRNQRVKKNNRHHPF